MYRFPKTERGLRSRIASYREAMKREKRAIGFIDDGSGIRYVVYWLLLVLGDLKEARSYIAWYEKNFPDDMGEPIQKLCKSVLLHRMGKESKARHALADLMLSNLYLIPKLIGSDVQSLSVKLPSSFEDREYIEEIPARIIESITNDEVDWMRSNYDSMEFRRYRKRHIEIYEELAVTSSVEKRTPLVKEARRILDQLKKECS
ncbi:MAG: hypothetical protein D9N11_02905 [Ketobacter sp.]|nr:MAG: hypothetical protein D9N11_02905 [Ketobacter sp.]